MAANLAEIHADVKKNTENSQILPISFDTASTRSSRRIQSRKLEYLKKQREILDSQVHLVEIDLLRGGEHTTAVPREWAVNKAGAFEYHL